MFAMTVVSKSYVLNLTFTGVVIMINCAYLFLKHKYYKCFHFLQANKRAPISRSLTRSGQSASTWQLPGN